MATATLDTHFGAYRGTSESSLGGGRLEVQRLPSLYRKVQVELELHVMSRSDGSKDYSSSSCDLLDRLTGHAGWPRTRDLEAASSSRVAAAGPGHAVAPAAAVPRTRDSESDAARGGRGRGNPRPRAGGCRPSGPASGPARVPCFIMNVTSSSSRMVAASLPSVTQDDSEAVPARAARPGGHHAGPASGHS